MALTSSYMLVQLSSLPVALSLPSLAKYFETSIDDVALIIVIYLLMLGSLVLVMARLGDRIGHAKVFFTGLIIVTGGSIFLSLSQELFHLIVLRGVTGAGAAMVMGNANAILVANFSPSERGRAFAIPLIGARFGTLSGLAVFGLLLHFFSWRLLFLSFVPLGLITIVMSFPILKHKSSPETASMSGSVDWMGMLLFFLASTILVLSGSHLHPGEESYTSPDALGYHLPMHFTFLVLLVILFFVEKRASNPVIETKHFRNRNFTLSLTSNMIFHGSMVATITLIPVLVEEGFGRSPIYVTAVLFPTQILGLFVPLVAGWVHDKYQPQYLRFWSLLLVAGGFAVISQMAPTVSFWTLPILMLPISVGTNMFNPINNAVVMNTLPLKHRGFSSGMLESSRELGHALGATAAAAVLGLSIPTGIEHLSFEVARGFFLEGFQVSTLTVVWTLLLGALLVYFQKPTRLPASFSSGSRGKIE